MDPTPPQQQALASHCGAQRFAFNWALDLIRANLAQREAERSYALSDEQLTPAVPWSAYGVRKLWNQVKDTVAPWWAENSKEAYSSGLANLATALANWHACRAGNRRGKPVGFPRFAAKRGRASCRFTTGSFGLAEADRRHVTLPRIGTVRMSRRANWLATSSEATPGSARRPSRTSRAGGGSRSPWRSSARTQPRPSPRRWSGWTWGVTNLAMLSTGEVIAPPKHLAVALRELRRLQRRAARQHGPDRRTRQQPSARWRKTRAKIAKLHARLANLRREALHQLTTRLANTFGTIVLEDLHVAGMLANHHLARAISDAGLAEFRRQIEYKTTWRGSTLVLADRWYPSNKTCSDCGAVKATLRLSERMFHCQACGLHIDRDLNAARNLARLADETVAPSTESRAGTQNTPAGNPHPPTPEAGTGYRHGKTPATAGANAAPQGNSSGTLLHNS
ncbi:IS607 family element RNA-guided endonuclease TnpB [Haloactinomyces albus]|uniref:Transposase n=1 Tax=Haloactinomyces albus TaxID=1352928 RepID=A0AAE3ZFK6_9ACTN|nr:IS607 family element RNA-guided endonuclease TnpB [Haloactinomyces albus]MDR7302708.1 putative transposase [Haloactinomyces albus]